MPAHLPWINHLAAREAGKGLAEFADLPPGEQAEWIKFTLHGPSRLQETIMIAEIRNMMADFLTGSKTLSPVDESWLDGILDHPDAVWERRVADAKARRREQRLQAAKARYDRERAAERDAS